SRQASQTSTDLVPEKSSGSSAEELAAFDLLRAPPMPTAQAPCRTRSRARNAEPWLSMEGPESKNRAFRRIRLQARREQVRTATPRGGPDVPGTAGDENGQTPVSRAGPLDPFAL